MKIFTIVDVFEETQIKDNFDKVLSGYTMESYRWKIPEAEDEFQKIVLQIEKEGPEAVPYHDDISKFISAFRPDVILTHLGPVTRAMIESAGNDLKAIAVMRTGLENVDVQAAADNDVQVFRAENRNARAVAEYTIGLILSETRNIAKAHAAFKQGRWKKTFAKGSLNGTFSFELQGKTIGLIGFGNIGKLVVDVMKGFDSHFIVYDPFVEKQMISSSGARPVDFHELLTKSDIISLHARLTKDTVNLVGSRELSLMKPTAYLINTARAGLIDKRALFNALLEKKIGGAALDVYWEEPVSVNDPFLDLDNITFSPHLGAFTEETKDRSSLIIAEKLKLL